MAKMMIDFTSFAIIFKHFSGIYEKNKLFFITCLGMVRTQSFLY